VPQLNTERKRKRMRKRKIRKKKFLAYFAV